MLGTPAHRLHRGPHVSIRRQEVPPRGQELVPFDPAALVEPLRSPVRAIGGDLAPDNVPVASDDSVSTAELVCLFRVESGVDPPEDHVRAPVARHAAHLVPAQGIARMDPDPDQIARLDA